MTLSNTLGYRIRAFTLGIASRIFSSLMWFVSPSAPSISVMRICIVAFPPRAATLLYKGFLPFIFRVRLTPPSILFFFNLSSLLSSWARNIPSSSFLLSFLLPSSPLLLRVNLIALAWISLSSFATRRQPF